MFILLSSRLWYFQLVFLFVWFFWQYRWMALYYVNGGANQGTWRKTPTANPKSIRLEVKTDQSYWIKPSPFNIGGKSAWSKRASSNNSASGCFHFLPFGEKKNQSMLPVRAIDCWIRSKQILAKNYALGSLVSNKAFSTFRGSDFEDSQSTCLTN